MYKTNIPYYRLLGVLMLSFFMPACANDEAPTPIDLISEIIISDNSNNGNGSDIEVNFTKQLSTGQIKEYRIFAIKATKAAAFSIEEANSIGPERYTSVVPSDIYTIKGRVLEAETKDVDGDIIDNQTAYIFGILTVSNNRKEVGNSFVMADDEFKLSINNLLVNHTVEFEGGGSSLSMDNTGAIFMGHYDIIADLRNTSDSIFPIYKIGRGRDVSEFNGPFKLLSGNALDAQQNLYQSVMFSGKIIKIDPSGIITELPATEPSLKQPDGLYVDRNDNLFVVDRSRGNVIKIMPDGSSSFFANVGTNPRGITGDESGNLYISHNREDGQITKVTPDGAVSILTNIPTFIPPFYAPTYIMWVGYIVYHDNFLYVAGLSTDRIYKVSLDGKVEVFAGSGIRGIPRGGVLTANLNRPIGLVFSKDGKSLFVSGSTDTTPQHTQASTPARIWEIKIVE